MATNSADKRPASSPKNFRPWWIGGLVTLLACLAGILLIEHWLSGPAMKQKIQQIVAEKTAIQIDYQEIGVSFFPYPSIELERVSLVTPDHGRHKAAEVHLAPEILPLFSGRLQLAKASLEHPELDLHLSAAAQGEGPSTADQSLQQVLLAGFGVLGQVAPHLEIWVRDARLSVEMDGQKQLDADDLSVSLSLAVDSPVSGRLAIHGQAATLTLYRNGQHETLRDAEFDATGLLTDGTINIALEQLEMTTPGLSLTGNLSLMMTSTALSLNLTGSRIDVEATRRVALALAGDIGAVENIFAYLRSGVIPEIRFEAHGKTPAELADLKNLQIQGTLQRGAISIPPIRLDLTEVNGDVQILDGILEGYGLSTQLEGSSGHDGTLKISLIDDVDLFQLELMLSANLAQAKHILQRIVRNPAFSEQLNLISSVQGRGVGKLTLGDSLADVQARVDVSELNVIAEYGRLPWPIEIQGGQVSFEKNNIQLKDWNGSLGKTAFFGLSGQIDLADHAALDFRSQKLTLALEDVYPWLISFDNVAETLRDIEELSGQLALTGVSFQGLTDRPDKWRYTAAGDVRDLRLALHGNQLPFPLEQGVGTVTLSESQALFENWRGVLGGSSFTGLTARIDFSKDPGLAILTGAGSFALEELFSWLTGFDALADKLGPVTNVSGLLTLADVTVQGPLQAPDQWHYTATGSLRHAALASTALPDSLRVATGTFRLGDNRLRLDAVKATLLDAELDLTGTLEGIPSGFTGLDVEMTGSLGQAATDWLEETFEIPEAYAVHTPLDLGVLTVAWQLGEATAVEGDLSVRGGPGLSLDISHQGELLQIRRLAIKDEHSAADLAMTYGPEIFTLQFSGALQHETLDDFFVDQSFGSGRLEGELAVSATHPQQSKSSATGHLKGTALRFPLPSGEELSIEGIVLNADGPELDAELATVTWQERTWSTIRATIAFTPEQTKIDVAEAKLCDVNTPGVLLILGDDRYGLNFTLEGNQLDLASSYSCLTKGQVKMTGTLDINGRITAEGAADELIRKLRGPLQMTFANGVIEQGKLLARTLEVLNVTEIVKGRLPKLGTTGFPYTIATVEGTFKDGQLNLDKLYMDGETLDILGEGSIDLEQKTFDVELLAAPFKTANTVVRNIPGINYLLADTLVTIPVKVSGPLNDPKVQVMSASSVGTSLLKLGERIIKAPFKLIQTLLPTGKTESQSAPAEPAQQKSPAENSAPASQ